MAFTTKIFKDPLNWDVFVLFLLIATTFIAAFITISLLL